MGPLSVRARIWLMAGFAIVLASAYAFSFFIPGITAREGGTGLLFPDLNGASELGISGPEGGVSLRKSAEGWTVAAGGKAFPAAPRRVSSFLGQLASLRKVRVVSSDPSARGRFDLGDGKERRIIVTDSSGKTLVDLLVGKQDEDRQGSFARASDSSEVVLLNASLEFSLATDAAAWYQLRFFPDGLKGADVARIGFEVWTGFPERRGLRARYAMARSVEGGPGWIVTAPADAESIPLDAAKVNALADALAGFEAQSVAVGISPAAAGLPKPSAEITITSADGNEYRLLVGTYRAAEDSFPVSIPGSPWVWSVNSERLDAALKR
jgi:Domain of unknown function (DUF4340)